MTQEQALDTLCAFAVENGLDFKAKVFPVFRQVVIEQGYRGDRALDLTIAALLMAGAYEGDALAIARQFGSSEVTGTC